MKKYKIILLLIVLSVLCIPLILFFSSVDETKDISTQTRGSDILNENIIKNTDIRKYANLRTSHPNGVMVLSINDPMFPPEDKKEVLIQINNLRIYGSLSGGKLTHEFENIEEKRNNVNNIEKTSFQPTNLDNLVDDGLKITGRLYSGAFNKDTGYDSVYRLYENNSGKKLEATEMDLNPASNTVMQVTKETLNHTINNVPMTFEILKNQDGSLIYNAQVNLNNKYWSLSAMGYTQASFEQIISKIIDANSLTSSPL